MLLFLCHVVYFTLFALFKYFIYRYSTYSTFSTYQWSALYKQAKQMLITGWFMDEGLNWSMTSQRSKNKTIAASLIARGTVVNLSKKLFVYHLFAIN
jgi:hypothetical protein